MTPSAHASGVRCAASSREPRTCDNSKCRVEREPCERSTKRVDVTGRDTKPVDAVLDEVVGRADLLGRHERKPRRGSFVQHHSPRLGSRRQNEHVGFRVEAHEVVPVTRARELDPVVREFAQAVFVRPGSDEDEAPRHLSERLRAGRRGPSPGRAARRRGTSRSSRPERSTAADRRRSHRPRSAQARRARG